MTEKEKTAVIESVRQTLDNYYDDIRKDGLTAEFKYLDNSPEFFWVPPGYSEAISYDSVATVLKQSAPKFKSVDNTFETLQIVPLNNEYATYTGRLKSTMTDMNGETSTYSLVETGVVVKRSNEWKLLNGQTSILSDR